jgi:hypothetical protein
LVEFPKFPQALRQLAGVQRVIRQFGFLCRADGGIPAISASAIDISRVKQPQQGTLDQRRSG